MNPYLPAHVGAPELVGWVYTGHDRRHEHMAGASQAGVQNAMHAVMGTPAFAHLARSMSGGYGYQAGQGTVGPPPAAPAYSGGPGTAYGGAAQVVERPLTDMREFPLGFLQVAFPGTTEAPVISRPQVVFRGERLVIPTLVAPFFNIIDIKVGNRSQLTNSTALPAQAFIETAVGMRLSMDTAAVAQDVALVVNNFNSFATTFQALIIGTAAQ
jgi:hypothetical protein